MSKYFRARKTFSYSNEFKARAVEMSLRDDLQVQQVASGLGIHPFMLSRWRKEYREGKIVPSRRKKVDVGKPVSDSDLSEIARLQKENDQLKEENDLLKKWQRFLAERRQNDLNS